MKYESTYSRVLKAVLLLLITVGCRQSEYVQAQSQIAAELRSELKNKLDVWYPRVVDDQYGGYLSSFSHDWQPTGSQNKMIVTQSRHLWTLSRVSHKYEKRQSQFAEYAEHGFSFLKGRLWDDTYGGFFETVTREGEPLANPEGEIRKTLYGNAFAIYGLAAYYDFSNDPAALDLAIKAFRWLEEHAHDPVYGGYFQPLARDGTPTTTGYPKDYNSSIHVLEAFAELYSVWPDEELQVRLLEMFHIVRDTITTQKGYMNLYFEADWTHLSYRDSSEAVIRGNIARDHVSPGHDIETAYLLLEAAHVLRIEDDPVTQRTSRRMADHSIDTGWDVAAGGFYDAGYYFRGDDNLTIIRETKNWWAQAEGLHTLMIMSAAYPEDPRNYFEKFTRQWEYIQEYLIDHEYGGWFDSGLDMSPERRTALKSHIWKGNYHTVRSLMGSIHILEGR